MIESQGRQADWRRANPSKYEAHLAVGRALKTGELVKQPCEICGSEAVDAHHDDYQQPLQVRWMCRRHHTRLHSAGEDMFPERSSESFDASPTRESRVSDACRPEMDT